MCGILGYFSANGFNEKLDEKLEMINYRGPDAQSTYYDLSGQVNIGFGHRRLSIIDLSETANQPFLSSDENYIIIFNGEIYNFEFLKKEKLSSEKFKSHSDTEVLLLLYIRYGAEMLNWLEGMFAFAIYDKKNKTVFVARDQLGIKPLYYSLQNNLFVFCSEIKPLFKFNGIEKRIQQSSITEYLLNGFLYEPDTGFHNIFRLEWGSYLEIKLENEILTLNKTKYWKPEKTKLSSFLSLENKLKKSLKNHLVSDVPVGLFFSGGVDSSLILNYCSNEIKSFMITVNEEEVKSAGFNDDAYYADRISEILKVKLNKITLDSKIDSSEAFLKMVDEISINAEELMCDFTFVASRLISKVAREKGFKVMLSGMGGDEIFGGYPRYRAIQYEKIYKILSKLPIRLLKLKSIDKKIQRFYNFISLDKFSLKYTSLVGYFSLNEVSEMVSNDHNSYDAYCHKIEELLKGYENESNLKKAMILDLSGFLAHNFSVADKSSMLESIEVRVPLATKNLFEFSFNLEDSQLISFFKTKLPLKRILSKYIPKKLIYRKKTGFNPPLDNHINKLSHETLLNIFENNLLFSVINKKSVIKLLDAHFIHKSENNTFKLYQLLFLSFWIKNASRN